MKPSTDELRTLIHNTLYIIKYNIILYTNNGTFLLYEMF